METQKTTYSILSNTFYTFGKYWRFQKLIVIMFFVGTIVRVALPFAAIYLPRVVIDTLTAQASPMEFAIQVGVIVLILVILNFISSFSDKHIDEGYGMFGAAIFMADYTEKRLTIDYELLEDPTTQKISEKASRAANGNSAPGMNLPTNLSGLVTNLLGLIVFGGVVVMVSPVIIILLIATTVVNGALLARVRKYDERTRDARAILGHKLGYTTHIFSNISHAKDIRLYSLIDFLRDMHKTAFSNDMKERSKLENKHMTVRLTDAFLILARDGAAYAFLIYLVLNDQIGLGEFVFTFAAVSTLAGWMSGVVSSASSFLQSNSEIKDFRTFCDYPNRSNTGQGCPLPDINKPLGITLSNVSYTYPNAKSPALENINLIIKPGERIAIVGANGAGKTTLIKMICGLYSPTTGEITLDKKTITSYNRDEYFSLFSPVFQDINLTTTGIIGNVSALPPEEADRIKAANTLQLSGLQEKVNSLPQKEDTGIVRLTDETAIELSGGERQKLALARALYKNAPVIILDEPTAALDPIAESEVYQQYAELTKGKTSLYISHRLASTRFCDRILFIENQTIAEVGTHDELMTKCGSYAHMFNIQSSYYADAPKMEGDTP